MTVRDDLRNVAIIAHVDHGKTTLVDAMLWQTGAFRKGQDVAVRVMDSMDLEREKGITILAKNTAIDYSGVKLNIVDTPGHADFGGEVERGLTMVDGVLLLVDASEGPLPQTRFVLRKALEAKLPIILVINKVDRPDARIAEVVEEVYELFIDLDADSDQIDFPIVYTNAKAGWAALEEGVEGTDLFPLLDLMLERIPAPSYEPDHPLQAHVTNLDASPYVGRLALCRVHNGTIRPGQQIAWCRAQGGDRARHRQRAVHHRGPGPSAGQGSRAGRDHRRRRALRGDDRRDAGRRQRPAPAAGDHRRRAVALDAARHQHLSPCRPEGSKVTARQIRDRLDTELVGNVSMRVYDTDRPDAWEVQGRGELQLVVLLEMMRREGFELTAGQPQVLTREIDGKVHEPVERLSIDVPEEYVGAVTQLVAVRKGRLEHMVNHSTGWVRIEYLVPARGLIGFRTEFLTETRGTGIMHHVFDRWERWAGELRTRGTGSHRGRPPWQNRHLLAAEPAGARNAFRRAGRGRLRGNDHRRERPRRGHGRQRDQGKAADQHARRQRRRAGTPGARHQRLSLEAALEFLREDECVEVTPESVRLRKVELEKIRRQKAARQGAAAVPR